MTIFFHFFSRGLAFFSLLFLAVSLCLSFPLCSHAAAVIAADHRAECGRGCQPGHWSIKGAVIFGRVIEPQAVYYIYASVCFLTKVMERFVERSCCIKKAKNLLYPLDKAQK